VQTVKLHAVQPSTPSCFFCCIRSMSFLQNGLRAHPHSLFRYWHRPFFTPTQNSWWFEG